MTRPEVEIEILRALRLRREHGSQSQYWTLSTELAELTGETKTHVERACAALQAEGYIDNSHVRLSGERDYRITDAGVGFLYDYERGK